MSLRAEVCVGFAVPIALPKGFGLRELSAVITNLNGFEPSLFSRAAAALEGGALPEQIVKKARVAWSVFEMDEERTYPSIEYADEDDLRTAFEKAASKILGEDHGISVVLQERVKKHSAEPKHALYLVHKSSMLEPYDVVYEKIRIPCDWDSLGFTDVPIEKVDAAKIKAHFVRLCDTLGLKAAGSTGWKLLASVGVRK